MVSLLAMLLLALAGIRGCSDESSVTAALEWEEGRLWPLPAAPASAAPLASHQGGGVNWRMRILEWNRQVGNYQSAIWGI
eukprot:1711951-Alexandrium_andersonii.AAC.1